MCNIFLNFFTQFPNRGIHPLQFGSIFYLFKPSVCWLQTNFSNCLDMFINRLIHGSKLIFQQRWTAKGWIVVSLIRQLSQVIICINYYILLWLKLLVDKNAFSVFTHALLQGIFPTQGLNPGLLHFRQILYWLSHQGSPHIFSTPDLKCNNSF